MPKNDVPPSRFSVLDLNQIVQFDASVKFTVIWVSTSIGFPFSKYGRYLHCFTASIAADANNGCPETRRSL